MWIARYLLLRLCEKYRVDVNFHPKPLGMDYDWNGSGMHTNFSTEYLREVGGQEYFEALMTAFDGYKDEHIAVYGPDNHMRLTGLHETQAIDKFNYGIANRGASVRVPHNFVEERLPRVPRRPPPELARRPVPDRRPDPADDRDGAGSTALASRPELVGGLGQLAPPASRRALTRLLDLEDDRDVRRHVLRPGSIGVDEARRGVAALNMTGGDSSDCSVIDETGPTMNEPASPSAVGLRLRIGERLLQRLAVEGVLVRDRQSVGPSTVFAPAPTAASISCPAPATLDCAETESCADVADHVARVVGARIERDLLGLELRSPPACLQRGDDLLHRRGVLGERRRRPSPPASGRRP